MSKTAILPVVSVICMAIYAFTGHEIPKDAQDTIAEAAAIIAATGVSIWGIYKNHKRKKDEK